MISLLTGDSPDSPNHSRERVQIPVPEKQSVLFKTIASCMAQGMDPEKVSGFLSRPVEEVRMLFKHSIVIDELKNLAVVDGAQKALENVLAGAQLDSAFTLIRLRDSAKSETIQYNSACKLIDLATKNPEADLDDLPKDPVQRAQVLRHRIDQLQHKIT